MLDIFDGLNTIDLGLSQGEEYKVLHSLIIDDRIVNAPDLLGTNKSLLQRKGKVKSLTEGLETTQLGLEQGQEYQEVDSLIIKNRLEEAPDLVPTKNSKATIMEGLADSTSSIEDTISPEIKELKKKLQDKITEYTTTHKLLMEESINGTSEQRKTAPYYDKIITVDNKEYSYINSYGYKHKYDTDSAWESRNLTCGKEKENIITVTQEKYDSIGWPAKPMADKQPCKVAGNMIKNKVTNEIAWVDVTGVKHAFSSETWDSRHKTCRDIIDALEMEPSEYDSIPTGPLMKNTDVCKRTYVSVELVTKLQTLDEELQSLAKKLDDETSKSRQSNDVSKYAITTETQKWQDMKNNMNKNYLSLTNREQANVTLQAKEESSELFATSNQMHFYVWLVFVVLLLCYLVNVVFKRATSIYDPDTLSLFNWQNLIVFVSCIWILSSVWKFRPNWMRAEWYTIPAWLR